MISLFEAHGHVFVEVFLHMCCWLVEFNLTQHWKWHKLCLECFYNWMKQAENCPRMCQNDKLPKIWYHVSVAIDWFGNLNNNEYKTLNVLLLFRKIFLFFNWIFIRIIFYIADVYIPTLQLLFVRKKVARMK